LTYQTNWSDHNVSNSIYIKNDEWTKVGQWVYGHFDDLCGVSFFPSDDSTYNQAPYEEISEEQYNDLVKKVPKLRWDDLSFYELEDSTTGNQELACAAGGCDVK
jgi:ribonucleoside-triphosphate reductase (thioredoxin)